MYMYVHMKNLYQGKCTMTEKELKPEELKLNARRKLLKLAVYSIPAIVTIMAEKEVYADEGDGSGSGGKGKGKRKGPKPRLHRTTPHGPKRYPGGLS